MTDNPRHPNGPGQPWGPDGPGGRPGPGQQPDPGQHWVPRDQGGRRPDRRSPNPPSQGEAVPGGAAAPGPRQPASQEPQGWGPRQDQGGPSGWGQGSAEDRWGPGYQRPGPAQGDHRYPQQSGPQYPQQGSHPDPRQGGYRYPQQPSAQGAYPPGPPPGGYPPPRPPRRSNAPLVVGILGVVLVLAVVSGILLLHGRGDAPAATGTVSPSAATVSPSDAGPTGTGPTADASETAPGGDDSIADQPTAGPTGSGPTGGTRVTPEAGPTIDEEPSGVTSGTGRLKTTSDFSPVINLLILDTGANRVSRVGGNTWVNLSYRGAGSRSTRTVQVSAREGVRDASSMFPGNRSMYYYRDAVCYISSSTTFECVFFRNAAAVKVTMSDYHNVEGFSYSYATRFVEQFI